MEVEVDKTDQTKNPTRTTRVIPRSLAFGRRQKEARDGPFLLKTMGVAT